MTGEPLGIRQEDAVSWLTLDRPEAANAIDLDLARRFRDAVVSFERSRASVVVIEATGPIFCAGGDVRAMVEAENASRYIDELAGVLHDAFERMARSSSIVIAAVGGAAAGAGFGIVLNADIVLATPRARFLTAYAGVGLSPDSGVSALLPRVVGTHRALELAITGRVLDAETACRWGIVAEVVGEDELSGRTAALARRLGGVGGDFLGETKRLVRAGGAIGYREHLADEQQTIAAMADQPATLALLDEFARRRA
jgi:2-(1,2-epoxy-1,2-dihydrophenyl)acetyl-CoA isomerase